MGEIKFDENKVNSTIGRDLGLDEVTGFLSCDVRCPYCAEVTRVVFRPYVRCLKCDEIFGVTIT